MGCGQSSAENNARSPITDKGPTGSNSGKQVSNVPHSHEDDKCAGGNGKSAEERISGLVKSTCFTIDEVRELHNRFERFSAVQKDDGLIDAKEFVSILDLEENLLCSRLFTLFDPDSDGGITFEEFVGSLSILSKNNKNWDAKVGLSFRLWDLNKDGFITQDEIKKMLSSAIESSSIMCSSKQLDTLIEATFAQACADKNKGVTLAEYKKICQQYPGILSSLTLDFQLKSKK